MTRTNADHHHQDGLLPKNSPSRLFSTPEEELIALARSKGQVLTANTLRLIRETIEIKGVELEDYVAAVRPHFRNAIYNPSGFLINFSRNFGTLSRPAVAPPASMHVKRADAERCDICKGERLVIQQKRIEPCPKCSTAEFRQEWQQREAERERRALSLRNACVPLKPAGAFGFPSIGDRQERKSGVE
jgi:hypothetical protein